MARAVVWTDPRGRLNVVARGVVSLPDGRKLRVKRRRIIGRNDVALAEEVARQLNVRFALGDLSWLLEAHALPAQKPAAAPISSAMTFAEWAPRWLETYAPPAVGRRTWQNYGYAVEALVARLGPKPLACITPAAVLDLRAELEREDLSPRTVGDRLGVLRLVLRDARIRGLLDTSPFDGALPRRRTKATRVRLARKVEFRPFMAAELELLLAVLRAPRDAHELAYFSATEMMLLTGLRWGEAVGPLWTDVSWAGRFVRVWRAVVRGEDNPDEPTKTAAKWTIPLRAPLEALLRRQQERTYVGRAEDRIFPSPGGGPIGYPDWLRRGWQVALRRAKVAPREGDAQKALRRSYVTAALVCGRNPKAVSSELGHTTTRMIIDVYDSFLDPAAWPDSAELARLASVYGWGESSEGAHVGPSRALRRE